MCADSRDHTSADDALQGAEPTTHQPAMSAVMGQEQTSTTLDRYTHPSQDRDQRVRSVFADFLLTPAPVAERETEEEPTDESS
jgi:hypothetical protein